METLFVQSDPRESETDGIRFFSTPYKQYIDHQEQSHSMNSNQLNQTFLQTLKQSILEYWFSPYLVVEILSCFVFFIVSTLLPANILRIQMNERPIPYQVLNNGGDVVLELGLNNEYILPENQTIPAWLLILTCLFLPLFFLSIVGYFVGPKYDVHAGLCVYFIAAGITVVLTDSIKLYVGRLRPNFYEMCGFSLDSLECEGEDNMILESRKSFPSGHSSFAFCAFTTISLFLLGKVQLYYTTAFSMPEIYRKRFLLIIATLPMTYAFFVAGSRLRDNWHHPADVVAGSLIGFLSALFSYSLW